MTWQIASGPRRTRVRGYKGVIWRYVLRDGTESCSVDVKLSTLAMQADPADLPENTRVARATRGMSEVDAVSDWASLPKAVELCAAMPYPFRSGGRSLISMPGHPPDITALAAQFSQRNLDLLLHASDGTWCAIAARSTRRADIGFGAEGDSAGEAVDHIRDPAIVRGTDSTRTIEGPTPEVEAHLTSLGYRVIWWSCPREPVVWRVSVFDESGEFVDCGAGETREDAVARIGPILAPAPRLRDRWRRWGRRLTAGSGGFSSSTATQDPSVKRFLGTVHRSLAWSMAHPSVVLPLSGAFIYALVRTSYAEFYGKFGVQPEEIGLTETRVLAQSVFAWGALFLSALAIALVMFLLFKLWDGGDSLVKQRKGHVLRAAKVDELLLVVRGRTTQLRRRHRLHLPPAGAPSEMTGLALGAGLPLAFGYALIALGVAFALWFIGGPLWLGAEARDGRSIRPGIGSIFSNPLGLRAERVRATVLRGQRATVPRGVMYLGEANGTTVLYDHDRHRTIRVPSSAVAVSTTVLPALQLGTVAPGQYVTATFNPTAIIRLDSKGWSVDYETSTLLGLRRPSRLDGGYLSLIDFPDMTVKSVVAELQGLPSATVGAATPVTVGKLHGTSVDVDVMLPPGRRRLYIPGIASSKGVSDFWVAAGELARFMIFDVHGHSVAIVLESDRSSFGNFARAARNVEATLSFE